MPTVALLTGAGLALGLLAVVPATATAEETLAVERWEGDDRFATAAAVAEEAFSPADVDEVYVASGRDFADALAGGPAAAAVEAPILLAEPTSLPAPTREEIERFAPERITLLGGPAAVDAGVESQLDELADTRRLAGEDRFATAAAIAADAFDAADVDRVYLATGTEFADALAGGAAAAAAGAPLLLTGETLPQATADQLAAFSPVDVVVLGGTAVVPPNVASEATDAAGAEEHVRLWGGDRFATAAEIAMSSFDTGLTETAYVAASDDFADALAAVPAAARDSAPMLLAESVPRLPYEPPAALGPIGGLTVDEVRVLGGVMAVNEGILHELEVATVPASPRQPASLELRAPDRVVAGEPFTLDVVVNDADGEPVPGAGAELTAAGAAIPAPLRTGTDGVVRVARTLDAGVTGSWEASVDGPHGPLSDASEVEVADSPVPAAPPDDVDAIADCEEASTGEPGALIAFPGDEGPGWGEVAGPPVEVTFIGCGSAGFEATLHYLLWHEDDRRARHAGFVQAGALGQWERFEFTEVLQRSGEWRVEIVELNVGWPHDGAERWWELAEQTFAVD